jgi:hypothetical protein
MQAKGPLLARIFGSIDLVSALVVILGVFVGLPTRWWVVDVPAALIAALLGGAGIGLVGRFSWGERVARAASMTALALGLVLVTTLAVTASYLSGIYDAVGRGGAVILALVAALALPYLVALPAAQLLWLGLRTIPAPAPGAKDEVAATRKEEPA